jgi:hypothetical protein
MSNVFGCVGRVVTIFALCSAIGLHWLTLQSIAWTSMIIDYSKRGTLCQAIAQTLDGAHPCSLCRVVNNANSTEKKSDLQAPSPKIDMICVWQPASRLRPFIPFEYTLGEFCFSQIGQSPPVPPPRSLLG